MVNSRVTRLLRKDELVVDLQADYDRDVIERRHSDSRRLIGGEWRRISANPKLEAETAA